MNTTSDSSLLVPEDLVAYQTIDADGVEAALSQPVGCRRVKVSAVKIRGVIIGELSRYDDQSGPQVDFPGNPEDQPIPALSTVAIYPEDNGRPVVLAFEGGDPCRPIVLGLTQRSEVKDAEDSVQVVELNGKESSADAAPTVGVRKDGERLTISAEKEIVLECGKASITLTSAGKILLRGAYVLSRASGVNKIKGGCVQIN